MCLLLFVWFVTWLAAFACCFGLFDGLEVVVIWCFTIAFWGTLDVIGYWLLLCFWVWVLGSFACYVLVLVVIVDLGFLG